MVATAVAVLLLLLYIRLSNSRDDVLSVIHGFSNLSQMACLRPGSMGDRACDGDLLAGGCLV